MSCLLAVQNPVPTPDRGDHELADPDDPVQLNEGSQLEYPQNELFLTPIWDP